MGHDYSKPASEWTKKHIRFCQIDCYARNCRGKVIEMNTWGCPGQCVWCFDFINDDGSPKWNMGDDEHKGEGNGGRKRSISSNATVSSWPPISPLLPIIPGASKYGNDGYENKKRSVDSTVNGPPISPILPIVPIETNDGDSEDDDDDDDEEGDEEDGEGKRHSLKKGITSSHSRPIPATNGTHLLLSERGAGSGGYLSSRSPATSTPVGREVNHQTPEEILMWTIAIVIFLAAIWVAGCATWRIGSACEQKVRARRERKQKERQQKDLEAAEKERARAMPAGAEIMAVSGNRDTGASDSEGRRGVEW